MELARIAVAEITEEVRFDRRPAEEHRVHHRSPTSYLPGHPPPNAIPIALAGLARYMVLPCIAMEEVTA